MKFIHTMLLTFLILGVEVAYAQSPIYKCIAKGKTVYSESPCPIGTNKQTTLDTTPEYMGNETYDRQTIDAARARIRSEMDDTGVGVSTAPVNGARAERRGDWSPGEYESTRAYKCKWVKDEIKNLDAQARQPQSSGMQDWIAQRKREAQAVSYQWRC